VAQGRSDRRPDLVRQFRDGHAAGELRRQLVGVRLGQPLGERLREHDRDLFRPDAAREKPLASFAVFERLREHGMEEQHLHPARAHQVDERVELLAGPADPDDVVEQKLLGVARRQPLVREVGPVHHHRVQLPHLRVGPEDSRGFGGSAHSSLLWVS
jgi:hypothetical protein